MLSESTEAQVIRGCLSWLMPQRPVHRLTVCVLYDASDQLKAVGVQIQGEPAYLDFWPTNWLRGGDYFLGPVEIQHEVEGFFSKPVFSPEKAYYYECQSEGVLVSTGSFAKPGFLDAGTERDIEAGVRTCLTWMQSTRHITTATVLLYDNHGFGVFGDPQVVGRMNHGHVEVEFSRSGG
jgi:hypothetical protein